MIYYFTPWNSDKNLGKAYNQCMELIGDNDWACFTDADTMFTTYTYGKQIEDIVKEDAIYTAKTNRVMCPYQKTGIWEIDDIRYHRDLGQQLANEKYDYLTDVTNECPLSGCLILISKKMWQKLGGFKEDKMLTIDNDIHLKAREKGEKVYLMEGVYLYHWYRGGNAQYTEHLKTQ